MKKHRVRFTQIVGGLAKIEGVVESRDSSLHLELAMTESIKGPVKGVLKRSIPYSSLKDVDYSRKLLRSPVLRFTAEGLDTFESIPGAVGFEYAVNPSASKADCRSFVTDVRLAIAEATMERFSRQIEDSRSAGSE